MKSSHTKIMGYFVDLCSSWCLCLWWFVLIAEALISIAQFAH